jgi:ferric-dicitrate binding protein FerR (iron transport regulator)
VNESTADSSANQAEEERVRRLLESAGPRSEVPPDDLAQIKQAFRAEWQQYVRQRQARRFSTWNRRQVLALAAMLLVAAVGIVWWLWRLGPSGAAGTAARVESVTGVVTARSPHDEGGARPVQLTAGAEVLDGTALETGGAGHAALRLAGGASLRLDAGSRVRLVTASAVDLARGAVYLDSGGEGPGTVAVQTPLGVVREIGTQFEVRLLGEAAALRVRVREGEVRVEKRGAAYPAGAGVELTLRAEGVVTRQPIASHGSPWSWVLQAAPPLEIEGKTLQEVLDQVARETGWTIRYADESLAASASSTVVHGAIGHLTPVQALDVVLPGAGLRHEVVEGVLVIRAD